MHESSITHEIIAGTGLNLSLAASCFPPYLESRPVSPSTIQRWIKTGIRQPDGSRLRLEARRIGGRWLTSREAIHRFMDALTPLFSECVSLETQLPQQGPCASECPEVEAEATENAPLTSL